MKPPLQVKIERQGPSRRRFAAAVAGATALSSEVLAQSTPPPPTSPTHQAPQNANSIPQNTGTPKREGLPAEVPAFRETIEFQRRPITPRALAFLMTDVHLLPSIYRDSQEANRQYLKRLDAERLLHNFRVNAGLPSSAQPLGGWEKPDCELRGHFVGHYLSACALMYAATGDQQLKSRGDYLVAELVKCQAKLPDGYLSAFPLEFFDRLNARVKVWAPFYTIHKIMAGLYDMHELCGNAEALQALHGMAGWADKWTGTIPEPHMQEILNTEYGGMNDVLYKLAAATGDDHWAIVGDRFTKKKFFNPLALQRDELRGLHANTHIPQVIGAAQRYELSGDERFHDVANFFWWEVTNNRAYVTGGTSNGESWLVEPRRLGAELKKSSNTTECCCAYNMLKLTRQLYQWTADPRYFDYYERTLLNHRVAAIDRETGATEYYLSIVPGAWKTFNTENDSFWCCTGTGVEEFSKLNDSIYFHDGDGLYVNLFVPSELEWKVKGLKVRQETTFPESGQSLLTFEADAPVRLRLHVRVPYWVGPDAAVRVNGVVVEATPSPGSYFTISRTWKTGDRVEIVYPMYLHKQVMADEPQTQALMYGPLVLAGKLGSEGLTPQATVGPMGPDLKRTAIKVPGLSGADKDLSAWLKPVPGQLQTFQVMAEGGELITFVPFHRLFRERYSVYWSVV